MDKDIFNITDGLIESLMSDYNMGAEYTKIFIKDNFSLSERIIAAKNYTDERKYTQNLGNIEKLYITLFDKSEIRKFTLSEIKMISFKFYTNYINSALLYMSEEDRLNYIDFLFEIEKKEPLKIMSKRLSSFLKIVVKDVTSWLYEYKDYIKTKINILYNRLKEVYGEMATNKEFTYIVPYELMTSPNISGTITNDVDFYLLHYNVLIENKERYTRSLLLHNEDYCTTELNLKPKNLDCISIKEMERILKNFYQLDSSNGQLTINDKIVNEAFIYTKTGRRLIIHTNFALMVYAHHKKYDRVKYILDFLYKINKNTMFTSLDEMPITFLCDLKILEMFDFEVLLEMYKNSNKHLTLFQTMKYSFKLLLAMKNPPSVVKKLIVAIELS